MKAFALAAMALGFSFALRASGAMMDPTALPPHQEVSLTAPDGARISLVEIDASPSAQSTAGGRSRTIVLLPGFSLTANATIPMIWRY
jgi:hypothetical protein